MNLQTANQSAANKNVINKDIFKAYDIRGEIGKDWCKDDNPEGKFHDAFLIGQALGSRLIERGAKDNINQKNAIHKKTEIIVGRDGRNSSVALSKSLISGLLSVGCHVTDIGLVATPTAYFSLKHLNIAHCAMVTGSHNPASHNGIKMVCDNAPTSQDVIEALYFDIINDRILKDNDDGNLQFGRYIEHTQALAEYQQAIAADISISKPLRIGIDAGNGATALFAEELFATLGCEVHPLFCDLNGDFPNHSPDPTVPKNLESLIELVKDNSLDIGIAFDGDGDRMIAVDNQGTLLWPDRILILLAQDLIASQPRNTRIVFDIKCSMLLPDAIRAAGGQAVICPNGHSIIKREMLRIDAIMGGEFSGHIIMRDRWNDFDDAPYVAARFLEILSNTDKTVAEVFAQIPDSVSTHEYKIKTANIHEAAKTVASFISHADFAGANLNFLDGLRVDYDDGWGILRSSNTSASLGLRFEAKTEKRLEEIKEAFRQVFKAIDFNQELPF